MKAYLTKGLILNNKVVADLISQGTFNEMNFNDSIDIMDVHLSYEKDGMSKLSIVFTNVNFTETNYCFDWFGNNEITLDLSHTSQGVSWDCSLDYDFCKETRAYFDEIAKEVNEYYYDDICDMEDDYNENSKYDRISGN